MNHRNIQLVQHFGRTDAGTLENLWRSDRAATQQHFLAGTGLDAGVAVTYQVRHADGTLAFEKNAIGQRVSDDGQGRALLGLVQITTGGTGATTVRRHGAVHRTETFLLITIEVVSARETGLHARLDHRVEQRIVARLGRGHADRTFTTVVVIRADVTRLGLAEVRQAIEVAPVFKARLFGPAVIVHRVAADVAHAVDERRTAQAFTTTAFHAAVVHVWLWLGLVGPVITAALQRECQSGWHLGTEIQTVVRATGFQQQNSDACVFGETGCQGVTGRAGTNDDVVVFGLSRHRGSLIELQVSSLGCKQKQRGDTCENGVRQAAFDCVCLRFAACHLKRV
ncbi:hypothetical protein ALP88_05510 [Pseudomonas savastanoi pv. glycinea]|nr:hypothetical protein ALP88_05510 [Pseudomonas savastanoi pv. glycinea]